MVKQINCHCLASPRPCQPLIKALTLSLVLSGAASAASAASVFAFTQTGGDVVGTLSGSLDLTGATIVRSAPSISGPIIRPALGFFSFQLPGLTQTIYEATSPGAYGTSNFFFASSYDSPDENITLGGNIGLSPDYVSGTEMSGSVTYENTTFASLGITPGDYVWSLPNDTFTLSFDPTTTAPVPLPAGGLLFLSALAGLGALRRRQVNG